MQRLASKINLLNRHVIRTRRRDMDEKRPERKPHILRPPMTDEEDGIYRAVYDIAMRHYAEFRLPVINIERILSSCIPAFVLHYLDVYRGEAEEMDFEDDDDAEEDEEDSEEQPRQFLYQLPELRTVLETQGAEILKKGIDSKFDALLEVLKRLDHEDPGCKIIIFTYFRKTIAYLCRRGRIPEGVPAGGFAEVEGAEVADGVRPVLAPTHSAAFQPIAHHRLAGRLHRAGADLPTVANVGRIVHAVFVIAEVLHRLAMHFPNRRRGRAQGPVPPAVVAPSGRLRVSSDDTRRRATFVAPTRRRHTALGPIPPDIPWRGRNRECTPPWERTA